MQNDYAERFRELQRIDDPAQRRDAARELLMRLDRHRAEAHDPTVDQLRAQVQQEISADS